MTDTTNAPRAAAASAIEQLELRRREALRLVFGAGVATAFGAAGTAEAHTKPQFLHGVASGDPLLDRVVIWTRVTPVVLGNIRVKWAVALDAGFTQTVAHGLRIATGATDWTVKVDVTGLLPGTRYFYKFTVNQLDSPVGRTRTLPDSASVAAVKLAIFSCSNFEKGYFNAYNDAAKRADLDAVLHLGDYNYEYGVGRYSTPALALGLVSEPRRDQLVPVTDTVLLDAYRARKALYRTDADLQALHAAAPWITIWDDHESANDSWTGGAENHDPATQGPWQARKRASVQAYYEWLPIREPADGQRIDPVTRNPEHMARSFDFGQVARLVMLDTRMQHRDQQLTPAQMLGVYQAAAATGSFDLDRNPDGSVRSMIGADQEAWLDTQLATAPQPWQVIGNQTLLHYQIAPDYLNSPRLTAAQKAGISGLLDSLFGAGSGALFGAVGAAGGPNPATNDSWNGYPAARAKFYGSLARGRNPVVVTGDSHNAWVANLGAPTRAGVLPIGVEFGGTSVTSPGYEQVFITTPADALAGIIVDSSGAKSPGDKLVYADTSRRGYMLLTLTPAAINMDYVYVSTVFATAYSTTTQSFTVLAGAKKVG